MTDQIEDRIYEAAFVPELWPEVLEDMSSLSGSASGTLLVFDGPERPPRYRTTEFTEDLLRNFTTSEDWKHSVCVRTLTWVKPGELSRFFYMADYIPPEQFERDGALLGLAELGLGEQITARVPMPSGETAAFSFERWQSDGRHQPEAIVELDRLRPHLARAGLVASRLWLEQAKGTVSALREIGLPAAVLSSAGRVLAANDLLEALADVFVATAHGGVALASASADALLRQAIEHNGDHRVVRSIPVPAAGEGPAIIVHLLPLRRAAHDIFSGGDALLVVTTVGADAQAPAPAMLCGLFDLTPAEARLAGALATGLSLKEAAAQAGIGFGTARNYLIRIFRKTGAHHQSQLVALLRSTHPLPDSRA